MTELLFLSEHVCYCLVFVHFKKSEPLLHTSPLLWNQMRSLLRLLFFFFFFCAQTVLPVCSCRWPPTCPPLPCVSHLLHLPSHLHAEVRVINTEITPTSNGWWLLDILTSLFVPSSPVPPPKHTHTHIYIGTGTHIDASCVTQMDVSCCAAGCCGLFMKIHGAISPRTEVAVLTVRALKEPWVFCTKALLFPVIRNVLVVQLGLCGWALGASADTERRLSALKCDKTWLAAAIKVGSKNSFWMSCLESSRWQKHFVGHPLKSESVFLMMLLFAKHI